MHSFTCVVFCIIKLFQKKKIFTILFKNIKSVNDETTRKSPLVILTGWSFEHFKRFGVTSPKKGSGIVKLDMASEKTMRVEEIEKGQQEMQEKIVQMTKTVTSPKKEKGITDDPNLQREPMSWKDNIDPSIVPNLNDYCEQEELKKKIVWTVTSRRHAAKVQSPKQEKKIEGVVDLESIGP